MTREDIEKLNAVEAYCFETDREEQWYQVGLKEGLKAADEHPKSPWISVNDDLPCNHEELIYKKDSRFTKSVLVRCIKVTNGEELYKDIIMSKYCTETWVWATLNNNYKVTHWMPIPNLP